MSTTAVDEKLKKYRTIQEDIQKLFVQKQNALSQFNENTLVKGEMDLLEEDSKVFKLVGPVLMSVELEESKGNVAKRLEFIEAEIKKADSAIAEKQGEMATLGDEIAAEQQKMQASAASAAREIAAGV
eukprot:CAMPEP_0184989482 /NCGR_PEP_ID=MMETSP1098-20130426/28701_1 /TAXON_ID=89044 /ORGANISM="Spumella elongata, Strain CCAP 955/1" /LENGTH=127 /DNA_ID=CAMNT_0027514499 /DNA_START=22 /DNA_END=405 /DNA_ORIENTATION=+